MTGSRPCISKPASSSIRANSASGDNPGTRTGLLPGSGSQRESAPWSAPSGANQHFSDRSHFAPRRLACSFSRNGTTNQTFSAAVFRAGSGTPIAATGSGEAGSGALPRACSGSHAASLAKSAPFGAYQLFSVVSHFAPRLLACSFSRYGTDNQVFSGAGRDGADCSCAPSGVPIAAMGSGVSGRSTSGVLTRSSPSSLSRSSPRTYSLICSASRQARMISEGSSSRALIQEAT